MNHNTLKTTLKERVIFFLKFSDVNQAEFGRSAKKITEKNLRSFWLKLRKILQFSDKYQFYSLKDTGITRMLNILNIAEVRDQARHSNISITDVYTDRSKSNGNERIKTLNFELRN